MIVNTAYPFMVEKGPTANPIIFDLTSVNYHYTAAGGAVYRPDLGGMFLPNGSSISITIPIKGFKQIRVSMKPYRQYTQAAFSMPPGQNSSGTISVSSQMEYVYQISKDLHSKTATLVIAKPANESYTNALIVSSAILE